MYAPANLTEIQPIIQHIASISNMPIGNFDPDPTKMPNHGIIACESEEQIINFLWDQQNVTQGG